MYIAVHSHSYLDFLHIYDVLVIGREIALPVWLVDVLISFPVVFLIIDVESLIIFGFYSFSAEMVGTENDFTIVIGILYLLYCLFLTLSINADYLV